MFALLTKMARTERETLSERIKSGLAEARRKGQRLGRPAGTKDSKKGFLALGCIIIVFSICGYVMSDWAHFSVYLCIRDVQGLRNDCQVLMKRRKATYVGQYTELRLSVAQLPLSFVRLGAERADVTPNFVGIYSMTSSPWKCNFGVVYIPDGSPVHETFRLTWYHNFYEFRPRGDE